MPSIIMWTCFDRLISSGGGVAIGEQGFRGLGGLGGSGGWGGSGLGAAGSSCSFVFVVAGMMV